MLKSKCDLQVKYTLAMALETEVARFDNPRVYRADSHLMNLVAFDGEKVAYCRQYRLVCGSSPCIAAGL